MNATDEYTRPRDLPRDKLEPRFVGFTGSIIEEKRRVHIPFDFYHAISENWKTCVLFGCNGEPFLELYPYNPNDSRPPEMHRDYSHYIIKDDGRNHHRITLTNDDMLRLGEGIGDIVVWAGAAECMELWGFKDWKEYWERHLQHESEAERARGYEFYINSILREKANGSKPRAV